MRYFFYWSYAPYSDSIALIRPLQQNRLDRYSWKTHIVRSRWNVQIYCIDANWMERGCDEKPLGRGFVTGELQWNYDTYQSSEWKKKCWRVSNGRGSGRHSTLLEASVGKWLDTLLLDWAPFFMIIHT